MKPEKKQEFIEKAYNQTIRLSELITDMALISKMEEKSSKFGKDDVDLYDVSNEVFSNSWDGDTNHAPSKNAVYDAI